MEETFANLYSTILADGFRFLNLILHSVSSILLRLFIIIIITIIILIIIINLFTAGRKMYDTIVKS